MHQLINNLASRIREIILCQPKRALMLANGLFVVALLLVPYASNGFWFDDALNSQVYYGLHRVHGNLLEFSYRVVKHWFQQAGRPMLGFFYGYPLFYLFRDLHVLRLAQCASVLLNITLYGYILRLLGVKIRFLIIWAIFLVGFFQIHGMGLDPVAGFAFHYQMLGIQLSIVLMLFVKWLLSKNLKYLLWALILWLFFMLVYEVNFIFIPIALVIIFASGVRYRKLPVFLITSVACCYFALTFYLRSHQSSQYAGTAFGVPSKMILAYLKQLSATFPFVSYLAITHNSLPFGTLVRNVISSTLAWAVFISSLIVFAIFTFTKLPVCVFRKKETFIISLGMFLLPAIFPAISLRYQNEVAWGAGTLPVYYQAFGLAFFAAWGMLFVARNKLLRFVVPIIISVYLAFNVIINLNMVKAIDMAWREPRDAFATQAQFGLFSQVKDGDVIYVRNVAHYINANLIFQWTGKHVYVPTDDHHWYTETPAKFARTFELSCSNKIGSNYQLIEPVVYKLNNELILRDKDKNEIVSIGFKKGIIGFGVSLDPLSINESFTIEIIVKPFMNQVSYAVIIGNHPGYEYYQGFVIQQDNQNQNVYTFGFGNGTEWLPGVKFKLNGEEWNYLVVVVDTNIIKVFNNSLLVASADARDSIRNSKMPLEIGNWIAKDRNFNGLIEEVRVSNGPLTENEIRFRFRNKVEKTF